MCSGFIQRQRLAHHAHRVLVQPVQVGLLAQPWRAENAAPGSLPRQHFLHYFSEEVPTAERGMRTAENTPSTTFVNKDKRGSSLLETPILSPSPGRYLRAKSRYGRLPQESFWGYASLLVIRDFPPPPTPIV
jgi:hypothetical protein